MAFKIGSRLNLKDTAMLPFVVVPVCAFYLFPLMFFLIAPDTAYYSFPLGQISSLILLIVVFVIFACLGLWASQKLKVDARFAYESLVVKAIVWTLFWISLIGVFMLINKGAFTVADRLSGADPGPWLALKNLYLPALFLAAAGCFQEMALRGHASRSLKVALLMLIAFAVFFGVFEGRRSGVILPLLLLIVNMWLIGRLSRGKLAWFGILVVALFGLTTFTRLIGWGGSVSELPALMQAVFGRLGAPVIALASSLETKVYSVGWLGITMSEELVCRIVGSCETSASYANQFGRDAGLLSQANYLTNINPGWIAEFYNQDGFIGVATYSFVFFLMIGVVWGIFAADSIYGRLLRAGTVLLVLSGIQMEVPHFVGALGELLIFVLFVLFCTWLLRRAASK